MRKHHKIPPFASKALATALAAVMLHAPAQNIAYAADAGIAPTQEQQQSTFQFKYPAEHTFAEINQFYAEHPYDTSLPDVYDAIPDIANEELNNRIGDDAYALYGNDAQKKADRDKLAGSLSQETLDNALNATNFMRYSAGLRLLYIHTNDLIGGYQWRAQAGAALLAELGTITHNVSGTAANAAGIVNGVFGWAKAGPGGSNCVAGTGIANKMVNSFMPDIGNDRTGLSHRSYILYPGLSGTGFGAANLSGKNKAGNNRGSAVTMMVTYYGADPDGLTAVLWPGNRQPIETFQARGTWTMKYPEGNPYQGNPWSYFINTNDAKVDTSTFKVTLECDGKPTDVLDFNNLPAAEKSENRLFTINSNPLKRLVAFRPHVAYDAGDKVTVTIEGIVDSQNLPIPVTYDVHFFQTGTEPHPNLEQTAVSRTAADAAEFRFTADYAGTMRYLVLDADQPEPSADEVLNGTEVTLGTDETLLDLTGLSGNGAKKLYYITESVTSAGKDYATASKSGEMSAVKSIVIEEYITPSMTLTDTAANRTTRSTGTVTFTAPVDGTYHYVVRDVFEQNCEPAEVLAGTEAALISGENRIDLTGLTDNDAQSVFIYAQGSDGSKSAVTRIELPAYQPLAPTVTPPTANTLTYNGTAQTLITAGSTNGSTMEYRLGDSGTYSADIPTAVYAGDYTVWYKVIGDDTYDDAAEQSVSVRIAKAKVTAAAKSYAIQTGDAAPDLTAPVAGEHYTVDGLFGNDTLGGTAVLTYEKDSAAVTPDTSKAGTYDIVFSGITEPTNGNYEQISLKNGTLTITARPSSGGGSGGHSSAGAPTYPVSSASAKNGTVSVSTRSASKGSTVTITVKPDSGYQLASLTVRDGNGNGIAVTQKTSDTYAFIMPNGKVSVEPVFEQIKAEQNSFVDVKSGDYFHDAVQWAVEKGVTAGTSATTFSPGASCTRAQTVTFLWRAAGSPEPKNSVNPFSDLDPSAYYYKAVLWATENGITRGTSADTFSPHNTVTRGQTVTFLYRAAGAPSHRGNSVFHDINESDYYFDAVTWAAQSGITGGTGDGKFSPAANCTRAQIVTMLYRAQ